MCQWRKNHSRRLKVQSRVKCAGKRCYGLFQKICWSAFKLAALDVGGGSSAQLAVGQIEAIQSHDRHSSKPSWKLWSNAVKSQKKDSCCPLSPCCFKSQEHVWKVYTMHVYRYMMIHENECVFPRQFQVSSSRAALLSAAFGQSDGKGRWQIHACVFKQWFQLVGICSPRSATSEAGFGIGLLKFQWGHGTGGLCARSPGGRPRKDNAGPLSGCASASHFRRWHARPPSSGKAWRTQRPRRKQGPREERKK